MRGYGNKRKVFSLLLAAALVAQGQGITLCAQELSDSEEKMQVEEVTGISEKAEEEVTTEEIDDEEAVTEDIDDEAEEIDEEEIVTEDIDDEAEEIAEEEVVTEDIEEAEDEIAAETIEEVQDELVEDEVEKEDSESEAEIPVMQTQQMKALSVENNTVEEVAIDTAEDVKANGTATNGFDSAWIATSVKGAKGANTSGAKLNFTNVKKEFNVKNYGASTSAAGSDNFRAFQEAIDAAHAYQVAHPDEQCKVVIPAGTYKVDVTGKYGLKLYSNLWIYAKDAAILKSGNNLPLLQNDMTGKGYGEISNILVEGGIWHGQGSKTKNTAPIVRMAHLSNVAFVNCTFRDTYDAHMLEVAGIKGLTVQGCTFRDYSESKDLKKEALQLDICNNTDIMPGATADDTACEDVLITGCSFNTLHRAVGSHSAVVGKYYNNIAITNNTFTAIKGKAINAYNYKNCTINNNTFTNCSEAVDFRAMSMDGKYAGCYYPPADGSKPTAGKLKANLLISGNEIKKDTCSSNEAPETAIRVYGARVTKAYYLNGKLAVPTGYYYVEDVYIQNNNVSGKANGISLDYTRNAVLSNNTIYSCGRNGVQIASKSTVTISGGNIHHNTRNGISNESSTLTMSGGAKVYNNKISGVYVFGSSKDVNLKNISSYSNAASGCIVADKSTVSLNGVTLKQNTKHGLVVENSSVAYITGGKIESNKLNGINVSKSKIGVASTCSISKNKGNGINFADKSKKCKIDKSYINNNGKNGIVLSDSSELTLTNSSVNSNKASGLSVTTGVLTAKKTTVKSNVQNGLVLNKKSKAAVTGCVFDKSSKNGITVSNSSNLTLKSSQVTNSKKAGISVSASTLTANSSTIKSNKENGIGVNGSSKAVLTSNNISSNGKAGVTANKGTLSMKKNTFTNNVKSGISLSGKAKATALEKNVFCNQAKNDVIISGSAKAPIQTTRAVKVNPVTKSSTKVTGTAHPRMALTVKVGSKTIGSGKTAVTEKFSIKIKKQKKNTKIVVSGTDNKGNVFQATVKVK